MKDYKELSRKTFDQQAETYDSTFYGKHARTLYGPICDEVKKLDFTALLDVGCGTGQLMREIRTFCNAWLFGIDLSTEMVKIASEQMDERMAIQTGDAEYLPYANGSMDVVICNDSFHHYPNPKEVLNEMYCVLRKGGTLLLGESRLPAPFRILMNLFMRFNQEGDVKLYGKKELCELLDRAGFQDITYIKLKNHGCLIKAKRGVEE